MGMPRRFAFFNLLPGFVPQSKKSSDFDKLPLVWISILLNFSTISERFMFSKFPVIAQISSTLISILEVFSKTKPAARMLFKSLLFAGFENIDRLVTDVDADPGHVEALTEKGIEVVLAWQLSKKLRVWEHSEKQEMEYWADLLLIHLYWVKLKPK